MGRYLERIHIEHYGAMSSADVGPFGPGMNVVFGSNEAGKTTVASFVDGVLFGWEEARGVRNTYRPSHGERAGRLVFADRETDERFVLSRERNENGLQGDSFLVADVDHATYRTMFSLTSDELRSLRNTSDVTAHLLAAGSGAAASPAAAFVEIEQRIAERTSRAPEAERSVFWIEGRLEAKRAELDKAAEDNELHKQQDRERAELAESRAAATARLDHMNDQLEQLHATRARAESLDAQIARHESDLAEAESERLQRAAEKGREQSSSPALLSLDAAGERTLRDKLDEYAEEREKLARARDIAKENGAASKAAFEALVEMDDDDDRNGRTLKEQSLRIGVSALLPCAFVAAGVPLFIHGRVIRSLSFTALGAGLVVMACFLAAAAFVFLLRPNKEATALETRREDAKWVMLQDQKKLDACLASCAALDEEIAGFLETQGLEDAEGSLRRAKALLDDADEARARLNALDQRLAALSMKAEASHDALAAARSQRLEAMESAGLSAGDSLRAFDALIKQQSAQRDALQQALEDMNVRYGELDQRLAAASGNHDFERAKLEFQQLQCRLRESKRDLAKLLLAKRMLEKSIAAWEGRNQPEVFEQASRLFSTLTAGAWTRVSMTGEGHIVACAPDGTSREVRHLSLGTCQQLYLALRMAMLLQARSVGASIPVLADDILVNFDAARRQAAARALAELARARQVIVFTCHRETVEALLAAAEDAVYLELAQGEVSGVSGSADGGFRHLQEG